MKRLLLWLILVVPLCAGAAFVLRRALAPVEVHAAAVARGPALATVFATGWIEAKERRVLRPPRAAIVARLFHKEGDEVRAGEPLLELRDSAREERKERVRADLDRATADLAEGSAVRAAAEAKVREAQAAEKWAKDEVERNRALHAQQLIEPRVFDQLVTNAQIATQKRVSAEQELAQSLQELETRRRQDAAELATLEANAGDDRIVAPFDGVVLQRHAEEGESVDPARDLMKFGDLRQLLIEGDVDEEDVARVKVGQRALVRLAGDVTSMAQGEVSEVFPDGDHATRSFRVRVRFRDARFVPDGPLGLRGRWRSGGRDIVAGTSVELGIVVDEKPDALIVPRAALTARGTAFVLAGGRVREREVAVGIRNFDRCEVVRGLSEGERVATDHLADLRDGARVEVLPAAASAPAAAAPAAPSASPAPAAPAALRVVELGRGEIDLFAGTPPATVLIFTRSDCPISNQFAPEVERLTKEFATRAVACFLVFVDPGESDADVRKHVDDFGLTARVVLDRKHVLVDRFGATITPEAVVLDRAGAPAYRGRIDDRYADVGVQRAAPTTHDLADAVKAVLAGRAPAVARTTAIGCVIEDLR